MLFPIQRDIYTPSTSYSWLMNFPTRWDYTPSPSHQRLMLALAGKAIGQLLFGWFSDWYRRRATMTASAMLLVLSAALCVGSYGVRDSEEEMLSMFFVCRFFLGIGSGGENSAGAVAAAEATKAVGAGTRNRWFILSTNFAICMGWLVSVIVPLVWLRILGKGHPQVDRRLSLGMGIIPVLIQLFLLLQLRQPRQYKNPTAHTKKSYWPFIRYYWFRLVIVSFIWFIHEVC
jgi:MFS family permease